VIKPSLSVMGFQVFRRRDEEKKLTLEVEHNADPPYSGGQHHNNLISAPNRNAMASMST
jgi:hypothetical protein